MSARKRNLTLVQRTGAGIVYAILAFAGIVIGRPIAEWAGFSGAAFIGLFLGVTFLLFNLWKTGRI